MSPFPLLRLLSHQHFTPGPQLAEALGVSRASVSLALKQAGQLGIAVHTVKHSGYKLGAAIDWLDAAQVAQALGERARYFDLHCFDEIDSTNSALLARSQAGAPSGLCFAAERQSAGRGRRGRQWRGSLGRSLMFSLLWRFNLGVADLSGLSLLVGLAVMRAVQAGGVSSAGLKWPNDIVCPAGKLGGILIEMSGEAHGPSAVVIGIGLNLELSAEEAAALDQPASSLRALGYQAERNRLLAAILAELAQLLPAFEQRGFAPFQGEWEGWHAMQGQPVRLLSPNGDRRDGIALGVAANGALRFADASGEHRIHSGEISLRPLP